MKVFGAFISDGLFDMEDVWDVWDVEEDVGDKFGLGCI